MSSTPGSTSTSHGIFFLPASTAGGNIKNVALHQNPDTSLPLLIRLAYALLMVSLVDMVLIVYVTFSGFGFNTSHLNTGEWYGMDATNEIKAVCGEDYKSYCWSYLAPFHQPPSSAYPPLSSPPGPPSPAAFALTPSSSPLTWNRYRESNRRLPMGTYNYLLSTILSMHGLVWLILSSVPL